MRISEGQEALLLKGKVGNPGLRIVVAAMMRESKKFIITTSKVDPPATKDLHDKVRVHQENQARILIVISKGAEGMIVGVPIMKDLFTKIVEVRITAVKYLLKVIHRFTIVTTKVNLVIKEDIVVEVMKDVECGCGMV